MASVDDLQKERMNRLVSTLEADYKLSLSRERGRGYPREIALNITQLHDRLVSLYTYFFKVYWYHFSRIVPEIENPDIGAHTLASSYVAAWIKDLYICNFRATKVVAGLFHGAIYPRPFFALHSQWYDPFLALLNMSIRPTTLTGTMEETTWVPYFPHVDFSEAHRENPFLINTWNYQTRYFGAVMSVFAGHFKTTPIDTSLTYSKPAWLLDWWDNGSSANAHGLCANAWFPMEGNYSPDLVLFMVLGIQLTEHKMAPCDKDDWQMFKDNIVPKTIVPRSMHRSEPRHFFGALEEIEIAQKSDPSPWVHEELHKKMEYTIEHSPRNMYRIINYCYMHNVVSYLDEMTQMRIFHEILRLP